MSPQACLAETQELAKAGKIKARDESAERCLHLAQSREGWRDKASIRDYLGKVYLAEAKFGEAVTEYREAIRLAPFEESYRFDLTQAYLGREQFREAVGVLSDALPTFEKSAQLQLALGVALYGERRFSEAVDAFLKTIALAPDTPQPYAFLGKILDQAGDRLPEVARDVAGYQTRHPDDPLGYLLLAKVMGVQGGDAGERERLLRQSLSLDDRNPETHYELGTLLESTHRFPAAAAELETSVRLNGAGASAHYHLARVYDRLGDVAGAERERQKHRELTAQTRTTAGMER